MAKAKPIKDMSHKQWNSYERESAAALLKSPELGNQEIAVTSLDAVFGRTNRNGDLVPPAGGYTTELIDGATRHVEVRRKQIGVSR